MVKEPEHGTPEYYIRLIDAYEREQLDYKKQRNEAVEFLKKAMAGKTYTQEVQDFIARVEAKDGA
jgi:hypothetical protein